MSSSSKTNSTPTHFDLRPNRLLLDPKFQGYKLSLDKLPQYNLALETDVDHARPSDEQYSIQHYKLQVFTNHILSDPWDTDSVYFVDEYWNVNRSGISAETRKLLKLRKVWTIPTTSAKSSGRYNVTLSFPDKAHAILADGCGNFYLLFTGDRNTTKEWKVLLTETPFMASKDSQFILLDSIFYTGKPAAEEKFVDLLVLRIDESSNWKEFLQANQDKFSSKKSEHPFLSILEWITLKCVDGGGDGGGDGSGGWKRQSSRTFVGRSSLDYASIEPNGTGLYVASNDPFYCSYDSEKPVKTGEDESKDDSEKKKPEYLWSQTEDKIMLWFQLPPGSVESDLAVIPSDDKILVAFKEHSILSGTLTHPVKGDQLVWALKDDKLEIVIPKSDNTSWNQIISEGDTGEEVLDANKIEHIHAQLSHLCSDKWGDHPHNSDILDTREIEEECDEFPADSAVLMRIDKNLQRITHQSSLGSHQWLFNSRLDPEQASSLCIRHDVDGILWQPKPGSESDGGSDWTCEHIATFSAFGYVQASKEFRKFTICPRDFSYVAICDSVKHVHVYRQPMKIENDLRNRKTGEKIEHIAKQHVVSIDSGLEILGAYSANDFMIILTAKNLIQVQMVSGESSEIL